MKGNGAIEKKQKNNSSTETAYIEIHVNILIPLVLKTQLVDDWEFVNEHDKLVKLPRSPNVDDILTRYLTRIQVKEG